MNKTVPAISIIIPMYNVEKYVGECLDSILNQTFTDYEVIAVDDCSTDKTCEVVESYLPRFNGKLQLIRSEKNSGGHVGIPRNKGMRYSIGDYLYFMDSDDIIFDNALEILHSTAEKFNADVVHSNKCFYAPDDTVTTDKSKLRLVMRSDIKDSDEPSDMPDNFAERVNKLLTEFIRCEPWSNFIRRDFLMESGIEFKELSIADDLIFHFMVSFKAKKIVITPESFYVFRQRSTSNSRTKFSVPDMVHKRVGDIFKSIQILDTFMNEFELFTKNPEYRYNVFNFVTFQESGEVLPYYAQIPVHLMDGLVRRELFGMGDTTALTAFLFARMNVLNVQLLRAQNLLRQQPKEAQDFQRQNEIIQRQQAQIKELQQQLRNVHDIFN